MDEHCQPSWTAAERITSPPARDEITPNSSITPPGHCGTMLPRRHDHDRVRVHEAANGSQ